MKRHATWVRGGLLGASLLMAAPVLVSAQTFSSGSTGADGPFNPTCTPTPCTVTVPLAPSGVFNYTTIAIPAGVNVTFAHNAANSPVTLLATGDVTIAGGILVDGQPGQDAAAGIVSGVRTGRGGPGGFDGGEGGNGLVITSGTPGLGPGGGSGGFFQSESFGGPLVPFGGGGASYRDRYGSPALLPLLGGSGGGGGTGGTFHTAGAGGGGGGAILIASSTRIVLTGGISAQGGRGGNATTINLGAGGGGSGGGVRLVANNLEGSGGGINVSGGAGGSVASSARPSSAGGPGGQGYIRLEAFDVRLAAGFSVTPSLRKPGSVFMPNSPVLRIASVAGISAPTTPTGSFATPDVILPANTANPVTVGISASGIPLGTVVRVRVVSIVEVFPQTVTGTALSGTPENSTASASVTLFQNQPAVLSAEATFTLMAAAGGGPIYAEGEEVKLVRVAATYGGPSTVTYITASGKEIPAEHLMAGVAGW